MIVISFPSPLYSAFTVPIKSCYILNIFCENRMMKVQG